MVDEDGYELVLLPSLPWSSTEELGFGRPVTAGSEQAAETVT